MNNLQIKKATKAEAKLRLSLIGASGAGKTFTALSIGSELGKKVLVVDTEHGSASKYADLFDFDVLELDDFAPENFTNAIKLAEQNGYEVLILDSLSHAWMGKGGILELHGNAEARTKNTFTAWKDVTPKHNALIESIVQSKLHLIATMRAKTEYAMKQENGRSKVQMVGLAPVQRDGMEYEFDVVAHLDEDNNFIVKKTRCPMLSEKVFNKAGLQVAEILKVWLQGVKPAVVKLPEPVKSQMPSSVQNDYIAAEIENHNPAEVEAMAEKADYEAEWEELISDASAPKMEPTVTPEVKGRLLAEAGHVGRSAKGYTVTETVEGQSVIFDILKTGKIVSCTCGDYAENSKRNPQFYCAHKWALQYKTRMEQSAKAA